MQLILPKNYPIPDIDDKLEYLGFYQPGAICHLQVWKSETDSPSCILICDSPDNKNTSVTNAIEQIIYLAWERADYPWPVKFFEIDSQGDISELSFETDETNSPTTIIVPTIKVFSGKRVTCAKSVSWRFSNDNHLRGTILFTKGVDLLNA